MPPGLRGLALPTVVRGLAGVEGLARPTVVRGPAALRALRRTYNKLILLGSLVVLLI